MTTAEAADVLGVAQVTVRRWVMKGWLEPVARNTRPLRFTWAAVQRANRIHNNGHHLRLDTLWQRVLDTDNCNTER